MNELSKFPHLRWYVSNLRTIPAGSYHYGASPAKKRRGTKITMSKFRMGATPVTWGMWKEYRKTITVPGKEIKLPKDPGWGYPDDHPVVNVSWDDIMNPGGFCEWASKTARYKLTLPSDAQYEYAARGGKDGLDYPWGNTFDRSKIWCSERLIEDAGMTAAVDRTNRIYRNGFGLTDMVGNVHQCCSDYFNLDYRPNGNDPVETKKSKFRYARGGTWGGDDQDSFRCASYYWVFPDGRSNFVGFRLVAGLK